MEPASRPRRSAAYGAAPRPGTRGRGHGLVVRAEGGAWTELPCNRSGSDCTVEVPEAVHQNKTIELYAVATDLSGHKGQLGSAEKPQAIRRKHWYDRLRGKG